MKPHLQIVLAALFALSGLGFSAQAETLPPLDPQATPLVLGTATQGGGRFIPPSAEEVQRVLSRHPHLRPMSVPAGTYRGQDARNDSVGLWSSILVRTDMPDTVAYRLAAAIHAGESAMAQRLAQGRFTTAENTVREVSQSRLHPGALRYYRGAGMLP